jgi:hypothetical protein
LNVSQYFITPLGTKCWRLNGFLHREYGPAVEYASGEKHWYINGFPHREDGPASIFANGIESWFYYGKIVPVRNQKEFEQYKKLIAFQ